MKPLISIRLPWVNYHFQPQWIPTLVCLVLCLGLIGLGRWQWQRAIFKEMLQAHYASSTQTLALTADHIETIGRDAQGLPVSLKGVFDNSRTLLLDNQMEGQQPGVHVVTPFHTVGKKVLLVNRGWMPVKPGGLGEMRQLPEIPATVGGELTIGGLVYFPSDKQIVLEQDNYSNPVWPLLVQKLDIPAIAAVMAAPGTGVELAPFVIRLQPDVVVERDQQMPRHWQLMTMSPEKHRAYAFQWYGLAVTLIVVYVVFSCQKVSSA